MNLFWVHAFTKQQHKPQHARFHKYTHTHTHIQTHIHMEHSMNWMRSTLTFLNFYWLSLTFIVVAPRWVLAYEKKPNVKSNLVRCNRNRTLFTNKNGKVEKGSFHKSFHIDIERNSRSFHTYKPIAFKICK